MKSSSSDLGYRVLHLLDTDAFAGTERHVLELIGELARQVPAPTLGCRAKSHLYRRAISDGLSVIPCWNASNMRSVFIGLSTIYRIIKDNDVQLIHAHNGRTSLTAAILSVICGVPAIATQHFIQPQFTTYRGLKHLAAATMHNLVNQQLSRVICVSEAARNALLARERIASQNVITVGSGIQPFSAVPAESLAELRRQLEIPESALLLATVSRLEPEKGVDCLLRAFAILRKTFPHAYMIVAGDGSERKRLETLAREASVLEGVRFVGFREDVATIMSAADIFVLACPVEAFGLVALEAMSLGTPVVACNVGGPAEIITDGIDGRLVNPGDPTALAECLEELFRDQNLREQLGRQGSKTCRERYFSEKMGRATIAVYDAVVQSLPIKPPMLVST